MNRGDRRLHEPRALTTPCTLPAPADRAAWESRATFIRERILAVTGLLPLPGRAPLRAQVFGRTSGDGYTVDKVHFESLPGFFVCGNLYRPEGATEPAPGIACPHGHWSAGRLAHERNGSLPGRGIGLARLGCVAFTYDMVGYNDSAQLDHRRDLGQHAALWGIGQLGLQLWNSLRVIDFLCSLDDVDPHRIGVTGASGGGTQTFLLTAVDDRVAAAAPVNMISGHMQGGCICENQPHLRLDVNNIEIAACAAPKPLMMVSATGDWTVHTPYHEFPAVRRVYELYGAAAHLHERQIRAEHNYNRASREAVYGFFRRYLLGGAGGVVREPAFQRPALTDLHVFSRTPSGRVKLPESALSHDGLIEALVERTERRNAALGPKDRAGLRRLRTSLGSAFRHCVSARMPDRGEVEAVEAGRDRVRGRGGERVYERFVLRLDGGCVPVVAMAPTSAGRAPATLLVSGEGMASVFTAAGRPGATAAALLRAGHRVLSIDPFLIGVAASTETAPFPVPGIAHFHTYNVVADAARVQDVLTAIAYLRERPDTSKIHLLGQDGAGLWCLLACALAGPRDVAATCADVSGFDFEEDWQSRCRIPAIRAAGDITTALALAAPARVGVHGASQGHRFPTAAARRVYRAAGAGKALMVSSRRWTTATQVSWLQG